MPSELFSAGDHRVVAFNDLVRGDDGVQANQFLVVHGKHSALIDPGGALLYTPLSLALSRYVQPRELTYILASHQDPDVIGSADRWLMYTGAKIVCSRLWGRFVPHSVPHYQQGSGSDRYILLPDAGAEIPLGDSVIKAIPAHWLHSVGNFQFYDPISRILFSGDMGASMVDGKDMQPVTDFASHVASMEGFHRRYMGSNKVMRLWARMVRKLQPAMIVPQHGKPFAKESIDALLTWAEQLECGLDLVGEAQFAIP